MNRLARTGGVRLGGFLDGSLPTAIRGAYGSVRDGQWSEAFSGSTLTVQFRDGVSPPSYSSLVDGVKYGLPIALGLGLTLGLGLGALGMHLSMRKKKG